MTDGFSGSNNLEKQGWEKKFIACEPRLSEAVDAYKEAGFEVCLEPLPKEPECKTCTGDKTGDRECRVCYEGVEDLYKVIYTRPLEDR